MNNKLAKLIQKREKRLRSLPPLEECVRGTVYKRQITCGKPYCHCAKGKKHTVWYLSATHPSGKTEQICLQRTQVPAVRGWVGNYNRLKKLLESVSSVNRDIIRLQRAQTKEDT
jgi:hypothetical protein